MHSSQTGAITYRHQGAFIEPTILLNVPTTSEAYQEEIFGPVVIVNTFENEAEVLSEANCTEFGLFCEHLKVKSRTILTPAQHPYIRKILRGLFVSAKP